MNNIKRLTKNAKYARSVESKIKYNFVEFMKIKKFAMPHFTLTEDFEELGWKAGETIDLHIENYPISLEAKNQLQYKWYQEKGLTAKIDDKYYLFINEPPYVLKISEKDSLEFQELPDYWIKYITKV